MCTSTPTPGPDVTVADAGSVAETLTHTHPSLAEFLLEQDGMSSDAMSDEDSTPCENMDSDFELDGVFGLGEDDDPYLLLEDVLFAEMCREAELSGTLLSKQHPVFC